MGDAFPRGLEWATWFVALLAARLGTTGPWVERRDP